MELPRRLEAGALARRHLDAHFGDALPEDTLCRAITVVSELVNNAVLHGHGRIELVVEVERGVLHVEVVDDGTGQAPAIREQGRDTVGGWGLRLVDDLSVRWGAFEGTTHVWADIAIE